MDTFWGFWNSLTQSFRESLVAQIVGTVIASAILGFSVFIVGQTVKVIFQKIKIANRNTRKEELQTAETESKEDSDSSSGNGGRAIRELLWFIALYDAPLKSNRIRAILKEEIVPGIIKAPFPNVAQIQDLLAQVMTEALIIVGLLKHIGNDKFDLDSSQRDDLRQKLFEEPEGKQVRERFVDYIQEDLDQWNSASSRRDRSQDIAEAGPFEQEQSAENELVYLAGFRVADNDLEDGERVLRLADGLVLGETYDETNKSNVVTFDGFLIHYGKWKQSLICAKRARDYAKTKDRFKLAYLVWAEAETYVQSGDYSRVTVTLEEAATQFSELNHPELVDQIHKRIDEMKAWLMGAMNDKTTPNF